jgi:hypothetical protein
MTAPSHPVGQEEVMAYLDAELLPERAALVSAHLETCDACRDLATQFRSVSAQMATWEIEPAPDNLARPVEAALTARPRDTAKDHRTGWWPLRLVPRAVSAHAWQLAAAVLVLAIVAVVLGPPLRPARKMPSQADDRVAQSPARLPFGGSGAPAPRTQANTIDKPETLEPPSAPLDRAQPAAAAAPRPMIARTSSVRVLTRDFDRARANLDRILRDHRGYAAQLDVSGDRESGRTLNATLRVPAPDIDAVLAALKALGTVQEESQNAEDVLQPYADLEARLANARHTEGRLADVLRQRTGTVGDVLEVEREIARVRGEIEQMEAQRKNLALRVELATVRLQVSEQQTASLDLGPVSTGTRLRNATIDGYRAAIESALNLVLFILQEGPRLVFWGIVLILVAWPLKIFWRRATSPLRPR